VDRRGKPVYLPCRAAFGGLVSEPLLFLQSMPPRPPRPSAGRREPARHAHCPRPRRAPRQGHVRRMSRARFPTRLARLPRIPSADGASLPATAPSRACRGIPTPASGSGVGVSTTGGDPPQGARLRLVRCAHQSPSTRVAQGAHLHRLHPDEPLPHRLLHRHDEPSHPVAARAPDPSVEAARRTVGACIDRRHRGQSLRPVAYS
jgi:hypothetical protein